MTMTHSSRKRSRACEDEEGCDFMPISKRINNLHIRSRSTLLNSDDEGHEENGVEQSNADSSCSCHVQHLRFLAESNGMFHGAGLQTSPSSDAAVSNGQQTAMCCSTSLTVPSVYHNGHLHHPQVFNGQAPHHGMNGTENEQLHGLGPQMSNWNVNGMFQGVNAYEPDLDESENPYYYHANEMLYQLHIARMQRISRLHGHPHLG